MQQKTDLHCRNLHVHRRIYYRRILTHSIPDACGPSHPRIRGSYGLSLHSLDPNHDVHWQIAKRSFRHMGRDRRSGSGSRSSPRRLLYNIHFLAMGVLHQYSNRDRRLVGAALVIRETRFKDPKYTTDYPGLILITIGLASVLFGLIEAQTYGWLVPNQEFSAGGFSWSTSNPLSLPLVSIITGIVMLGVFAFYEIRRARKGRVPLFDFSLLKYKGFRYGLFTVTIVAMGEFGAVFIISIFLQTVKGLSAISAGLTFLPMAISVFIFAPIAGVLATRVGLNR